MLKVQPSGDLFEVQAANEAQVYEGTGFLLFVLTKVALLCSLCSVDRLQPGERGAHGRPDEEHRALLVKQLICPLSASRITEIPRPVLLIGRGEVESHSGFHAIFASLLSHGGYSRSGVHLADNGPRLRSPFTSIPVHITAHRVDGGEDLVVCANDFLTIDNVEDTEELRLFIGDNARLDMEAPCVDLQVVTARTLVQDVDVIF